MMNMDPQAVFMQFQNLKMQIDFYGMQLQNLMMNSNLELVMNGIEIMNIGLQLIKLNLENNNINAQIPNSFLQIQNLGLQLENFGNKFKNYGMMTPNFIQMKSIAINDINNININTQYNGPMQNVIFQTSRGKRTGLVFPYGTAVEKVLETYLIQNPEIKKEKCFFLYNAERINQNDKTKVEDYFQRQPGPKIYVNY